MESKAVFLWLTRLNLVLHGTNGAGQALTFSRSSVRFGAVKKDGADK